MDKGRNGGRTPDQLEAPAKGNVVVYDTEQVGFGVRVTSAGARSFIFNYWIRGRERRLTVGTWPEWTVAAARLEAKRLRQEVDRGNDPLGAKQEAHGAATVAQLAERYIAKHLPTKRKRSAADDTGMIRLYIMPAMGAMKVADVDRDDVMKLHDKITATGKRVRANRVVALLSKMFTLADEWKMRKDGRNPAKGLTRNQEEARERYLEDAKLDSLKRALNAHADRAAAEVVWLLILTGARRGEILAMRWDQIDFAKKTWTKPASTTKQNKVHKSKLGRDALELLAAKKQEADDASPWVFPSHGSTGHLTEIKRSWQTIKREAGMPELRMHDLRHNYASLLISAGYDLPVIGGMLGHSNVATTARYAHLKDDTANDAANAVGRMVGKRIQQI